MTRLPVAAAVCLMACVAWSAESGNPYPDSATGDWFQSLMIPGIGTSCCSAADCHQVVSEFRDGHYWAITRYYNEWIPIPDQRVLHEANPLRMAVLCELDRQNGAGEWVQTPTGKMVWIFCFVPEPLGF